MKVKLLLAAAVAALAAGVAATTATAAGPPDDLRITPGHLNFGWVTPGDSVVKPVTITNRTSGTLYYHGSYWPNYMPGSGSQYGFDWGFWSVSPSFPDFPCMEIASESSCTLYFQFKPHDPGNFYTYFETAYSTSSADQYGWGWNWWSCSMGYGCAGTMYQSNRMDIYGYGLPH